MASKTTPRKTTTTSKAAAAPPVAIAAGAPAPAPDRAMLEAKYADKLAAIRAKRESLQHITKVRQPITAATLASWYAEKKLIVAGWNRDEVKNRTGTPAEWEESLAEKVCPGHFIAYYVGVPGKDGKIVPTKENPIVVYEGGHRTRWTAAVFSNSVLYHDIPYSDLEVVDPDTAKAIASSVIEMTVATSTNAGQLIAFAKHEYNLVNTHAAIASAGEIIRTEEDADRAKLETAFRDALKAGRNGKKLDNPTKRDVGRTQLRALVHGAAGLVNQMDTKIKSLVNVAPLTEKQIEKATEVIAWVKVAEAEIAELFSDKKVKTRVLGRKLDLPCDGTLVYALQAASSKAERRVVVNDWVAYHRMFFEDKDIWAEKMKELKKATVERSRYKDSAEQWGPRWLRIQNSIRPPVLAADVAEIVIPALVPE